jgi:hypothetical protein
MDALTEAVLWLAQREGEGDYALHITVKAASGLEASCMVRKGKRPVWQPAWHDLDLSSPLTVEIRGRGAGTGNTGVKKRTLEVREEK